MALRRGNAVASDPAAASASINTDDLDTTDDVTPEKEHKTTPPPDVAKLKPASPPPQQEAVTSLEANAAAAEQAETQVAASQAATTAVVPHEQSQLPATRAEANTALANSSADIQAQLEALGFEGLFGGFGSFPIISLQNEGYFESSEGGNLGQEFYCVLGSSKAKYIFKNNATGKDEDFVYSYDGVYAVSGEKITDITAAWAANGYTFEKKNYADVQATLRTDDEEDGTLILLSLPKTTIPRFFGFTATMLAQGKPPSSYITRIYMGDKVTKVKHPFYPWAFKFYADLQD